MATELHQRMTPLLQRIAGALVEATPEEWTEAALRVEFTRHPDGSTTMGHSIWSDHHRRPPVEPTEDIYAATHELHQLCEQCGQPWTALEFWVEQDGESWKFRTKFEYAAEPRTAPDRDGSK
jgi:hypothetical protein